MQKEFYDALSSPFKKSDKKRRLLIYSNRFITAGVYVFYLCLLVFLIFTSDDRLFRVLLVPALSFVLVTLIRKAINAPRPYEVFGEKPLIEKDTKGCSFPSRHIFSIYIIAIAAGYIYPAAGTVLAIAGVILATARMAAGVHFLKDVVAGAAFAAAFGLIGFYII